MHSGALWFSSGSRTWYLVPKLGKSFYHKPSLSWREKSAGSTYSKNWDCSWGGFLYCVLCCVMITEAHCDLFFFPASLLVMEDQAHRCNTSWELFGRLIFSIMCVAFPARGELYPISGVTFQTAFKPVHRLRVIGTDHDFVFSQGARSTARIRNILISWKRSSRAKQSESQPWLVPGLMRGNENLFFFLMYLESRHNNVVFVFVFFN